MSVHDGLVIALLFTAASLGIVAGAGVDIVPPILKLAAAAIAAGCASVLAVLSPVGMKKPPEPPKGEGRG